jgi:hypothetical protein
LKARFCHAIPFKPGRKPHHIAAGGVRDVNYYRRWRKNTYIARIAEVIEGKFRVHVCFNYR